LAILRRQEGEMSLTTDELSPKFMLSKEISHATPAGSDHTGLRALDKTISLSSLA
jgi:hypothetical protein